MSPNLKLIVGALMIAGAAIYLAYVGASSSWSYYVLVDECVENQEALKGHRLRVSGRVATKTLHIRTDRSAATFTLRGTAAEMKVTCRGPLPDNLEEDMEVVVEGTLKDGHGLQLQGDRVLTRCASKYQAAGST